MAAIREALEIVDRATAPLRAVTTAFTGATSAAEMAGAAVRSAEEASAGLGRGAASAQGLDTALLGLAGAAGNTDAALRGTAYAATTSIGAFNAASHGAVALGTSLRLAGQAGQSMADRVNRSADSLEEAFGEVTRVIQDASSRMTEMGQQGAQATRTAASGVDQLAGKVKSLLATLGGFAAIRGVLSFSDELSMTQTRINNITGDLAETANVQRQIYEAAQRSRGSYQEMMGTVASLKAQTGDTFSSIQEATAFTELLQKQFKIAGTDATGIASTMYNLTQALSTGTLKGQDLNTVFANAPQLVQRIADYMGQPIGKIKDLASEGKITADIVKGAIIGAADDINAQFDAMPLTFGDAVQKVRNVGVRAFQPLGQMIADAVASPRFDSAMQTVTRGIMVAAEIGRRGFEIIGTAVDFVADHMEVLGPIIGGLALGFGAYNAVMGISAALTTAQGFAAGIAATANSIHAAATTAAAAGQSAFNAALAACPITWVVAAIVAAIVVVGVLIAVFHNLAATGHTVFGDIAGVAVGCFSVIANALAIVANAFLAGAEMIANGWNTMVFNIQTAVLGFASGAVRAFASVVRGAENAANAIANAFISGANAAIGGINGLINAINQIPGVNLSTVSTIGAASVNNSASSAIEGLAAAIDNLKPEAVQTVSLGRFETVSMGEAFSQGFDRGAAWGDGVQSDLLGAFSGLSGDVTDLMGGGSIEDLLGSQADLASTMGDAAGAGSGGKGNVGSVDKVKKVDSCKLSDEDLKLYRDLAEQRYINQIELQTLAPQISVSIPESAAKNLTSQDIADRLKVLLIEQQAAHTAVAHG